MKDPAEMALLLNLLKQLEEEYSEELAEEITDIQHNILMGELLDDEDNK